MARIPITDRKSISVRVPRPLADRFERAAVRERRSMSCLAEVIFEEWLAQYERRPARAA